jgi:hypothetical protein
LKNRLFTKSLTGALKMALLFFPPAIQALLMQVVSLLLCLSLSFFLRGGLSSPPSVFFYVIVQAAIAAFFAFIAKMDWWWRFIQFFFPVFIWGFLLAGIPSYYYLAGFVILALLFWSTFRTQVPYYPSKGALLPVVLELLPKKESIKFVDIGSGLGGLLLRLSRVRTESNFIGIEIAPLPWIISYFRSLILRSKVQFFLGNYEEMDFVDYDVVFAYLSPVVMPGLWAKVKSEMRPGSMLLSYEFIIPGVEPDLCLNIAENDPFLYVWRI